MFIKLILSSVNSYLLENSSAPKLSTLHYRGIAHDSERPWLALGLVLGAHLAVLAAVRPQTETLPVQKQPEPIMISLLSTPQPVTPAAQPKPAQPSVKPQPVAKKAVKTPPVSKPVLKQTVHPVAAPVPRQIQKVSAPVNEPVAVQQPSKPADSKPSQQTYQSPNFNAAYLNNPAPNYPSVSRRLGEEGLVMLEVQVNTDGTADSVELQTSSGSSRLDQAALEAVKQWRFVPAKRGDQSVTASVVVPVRFSLEG
ncbi:MAG: TonB family protein [Methylobacter sp.]